MTNPFVVLDMAMALIGVAMFGYLVGRDDAGHPLPVSKWWFVAWAAFWLLLAFN